MTKKNKNKTTIKSDKTAFTKEEFYGKSRKSRRQRGKNKKSGNVSRETKPDTTRSNKIVLSVDEVVDGMIEKYNAMHPELADNS